MKKKSWIISLFAVTMLTASSWAQKSGGYFGSKLYVQALTLNRLNIFSLLLGNEEQRVYHGGFAFNGTYRVNRSIGLQLEVGRQGFDVVADRYTYETFRIEEAEAFAARTAYVMPKLVVSGSNMQPLGMSHEFGVGLNFGRLIEGNYRYEFADASAVWGVKTAKFNFDQNKATRFYSLQYAFNYHLPITKKLLIGFHLRYMLHLGFPIKYISDVARPYFYENANDYVNFNQQEQDYFIRKYKRLHFINFGFGLCYSI